jgi:hypothetical protein
MLPAPSPLSRSGRSPSPGYSNEGNVQLAPANLGDRHPVPVRPVIQNQAVEAGILARAALNLAHSLQQQQVLIAMQLDAVKVNVNQLQGRMRRMEGRRATVEAVACCCIFLAIVVVSVVTPLFRRYYSEFPSGSSV